MSVRTTSQSTKGLGISKVIGGKSLTLPSSRYTGGGTNVGPDRLFYCTGAGDPNPSTTRYLWFATQTSSDAAVFNLCANDSHFSSGSTIQNVTTGDTADPISNGDVGYAMIRFDTPRTVTGVIFSWQHNGNMSYCAGNGFYLIGDNLDGLGPIKSYKNTTYPNAKTFDDWMTQYSESNISLTYNAGGGCSKPNNFNYPQGSFSYPNIRWAVVTTGRPGYVTTYGGNAIIYTTTGNITM